MGLKLPVDCKGIGRREMDEMVGGEGLRREMDREEKWLYRWGEI